MSAYVVNILIPKYNEILKKSKYQREMEVKNVELKFSWRINGLDDWKIIWDEIYFSRNDQLTSPGSYIYYFLLFKNYLLGKVEILEYLIFLSKKYIFS